VNARPEMQRSKNVWDTSLRRAACHRVLAFHSAVRRLAYLLAVAFCSTTTLELASCGGHTTTGPDGSIIVDAGPRLDGPYFPEASCYVRIESPPEQPGIHVSITDDAGNLTQITTWDSNPPSSGEHYPIWAAFQEFDAAVPRGFYVHDLEHGAVVFLYNCADGGACASNLAGLRQAVAALPDDPICDPSIRVRSVITPDPLIDYPVAAAAWGWTYNAACLDLPTLEAFAKGHYGQSPETECANGVTSFDY
jgi:hypothetical protein